MTNFLSMIEGIASRFISNIGVKAVGVVFYFLILAILPPEQAGLFFIATAFYSITLTLTIFGIPAIIRRFIPFYLAKGEKQKANGLLRNLLLLILIVCPVILIVFFVFNIQIADIYGQQIADLLPLIGLYVVFSLPFALLCTLLDAHERFVLSSVFTFLARFLKLIIPIALIFLFSKTAVMAYVGIVIAEFLILLAIIPFVWRYLYNAVKDKTAVSIKETFNKIITFGIPVYVTNINGVIMSRVDVLILGYFVSAPLITGYSAIMLIANNIVPFIASPISSIQQPILSREYATSLKKFREIVIMGFKWSVGLGIPMCLIILVFAPQIIGLLFPQYSEFYWLLYILVPGYFLTLVDTSFSNALFASGRADLLMIVGFMAVIPNVVLNLLLIPSFGLLGASIATSVSLLISAVITIYFSLKNLPILWGKSKYHDSPSEFNVGEEKR